MSNFLEKFVELGQRLQSAPEPRSKGLLVSGKEIFDTRDGTLLLVKEVVVTELLPAILVQVHFVDPSTRDVKSKFIKFELNKIDESDLVWVKAIIKATSIFAWSFPNWLSSNQAHHMLNYGVWDEGLVIPVQRVHEDTAFCSRNTLRNTGSNVHTCAICGDGSSCPLLK